MISILKCIINSMYDVRLYYVSTQIMLLIFLKSIRSDTLNLGTSQSTDYSDTHMVVICSM